jgi:hypothetical protein
MLKWSGAKQAFLLSPQSSALITYLLTLNTDTRNLTPKKAVFCELLAGHNSNGVIDTCERLDYDP